MNEERNHAEKQKIISHIGAQMRLHSITLEEIRQEIDANQARPIAITKTNDIASRLFSILGGIFIFSGLTIYIGMHWLSMNSISRVLVTLGVGLAMHTAAIVFLRDNRYATIVKALFFVAAIMQTGGWFVLLDEYFSRSNNWRHAVLFVTGVMAAQQFATFYRYRLTLLLFIAICFAYGFVAQSLDLLEMNYKLISLAMGISMIAIARKVHTTPHQILSGIGYFLGGCFFFSGFFEMVRYTPLEILYLSAACGMIYISTRIRSSALLTVSTFALLGYIGYFTARHFINSAGWALSLIGLGIVFFAISTYSLRLKRKYISPSQS